MGGNKREEMDRVEVVIEKNAVQRTASHEKRSQAKRPGFSFRIRFADSSKKSPLYTSKQAVQNRLVQPAQACRSPFRLI